MHTDGGQAAPQDFQQQVPLGRVLPDGLHRQPFAVHHRMVADNQLAVFRDGLVRHGLRDVQGHQDPPDLRLRVPQQLAHVVPVHGALLRGQSEQGLFNFPDSWHGATLPSFAEAP